MTGVSTLGQSISQVNRLKTLQTQLDTLSLQLSTGRKASLFKGLEEDVIRSQRTRADLNQISSFQRNIDLGTLRLDLMINSVSEIERQVGLAQDSLNIEVTQGQIDLSQVKDAASNAFDQIVDLLNEKEGNTFLFAGADTGTQPITAAGALETAINTLLEDWQEGDITTEELISNIQNRTGDDALNDTLVGYSSTLANAKNVTIRADENAEIDYTVKADEDGFRNVLVALAVLKQLPADANGQIDLADTYDDDGNIVTNSAIPPEGTTEPEDEIALTELENEREDNFFELYNAMASLLADGKSDTFDGRLSLEGAKERIDSINNTLKLEKNALENLITEIENVDLNETAVQLNSVQLQLEASYNVTSSVRRLSLVNFI